MATSVGNISRNKGDTTPFTVTILESDAVTPIDVTGFAFTMTVDPSATPPDNTTKVFDLTVGAGIVISDGPAGVITVTLTTSAADTEPGNYHYDIQMVDLGGIITTILKGTYKVIQGITK